MKERAKEIAESKKRSRDADARPGYSSAANGRVKKEKQWGDLPDYEGSAEEVPEYIQERRRDFDEDVKKLSEAGLKLPPGYEEVEFSDDERIAELAERPAFPKTLDPSRAYKDIELPHSAGVIPASIAQYLRDYQVEGVAFLHELFVYQKGGILGDDMGLGKTVQVAAFLAAAFGKTGDERDNKRMRKMRRAGVWYPRVLIVCPGSLIENWKNELNRWGWWHVDKYHGSQREREEVLAAAKAGMLEVMITTYTTYRMHTSDVNMVQWDCVVADECHQLKEPNSATTQSMNQVNALCRIGLTGTAIQNKYEELWTLLNWTNPGVFGPLFTWITSICVPLKYGQSHDATYHQLKVGRETAKRLTYNLLPPFFLRRMKSLIAHQLPKKTDKVVFCALSDIQKDAYERFLDSEMVDFVRSAFDECDCDSGKTRGGCCYKTMPETDTSWKALVFPIIMTLQKLSNHLALLIPRTDDPREKQERDIEMLQVMLPDQWEELYRNRDSILSLSNPEFCGKWKVLKRLLAHWHQNNDKVLIFSHSVKLLKMLEHLFNSTSYNVSFLSGAMPLEDRQKTVDDFNSDPNQFVFLISTKAGGVGLNITSANKVVIFDPNWNPSYDLQAQDRAYRIGQLRDVEVYRLVSAGTVEEIVYARQIYKQQQANIGYNASTERRYFKGVQNSKGQKGELFGLDNLLTFHGNDIVLREIVNKTNVAEAKQNLNVLSIEVDIDEIINDEDNPLRTEDDDNGDGTMSQLAALITAGEKGKKKIKAKTKIMDPIAAILASAGVQYTHENSEVVGSSKIEAELSRRAEEAGNDVSYGERRLFAESQSQSLFAGLPRNGGGEDASDGGRQINCRFHPPEDVLTRQFCTMAKTFGFKDATDFAFVVEGWTQKQRTNVLERFYGLRRERLRELEGDGGGGEGNVEAEKGGNSVYGNGGGHNQVAGAVVIDSEEEDDDDDLDVLPTSRVVVKKEKSGGLGEVLEKKLGEVVEGVVKKEEGKGVMSETEDEDDDNEL